MASVAIFGGSGFLGVSLAKYLEAKNLRTYIYSRSTHAKFHWNPVTGEHDPLPEPPIAWINLAGANLANSLWLPKRKKLLRSSRIDSTKSVVEIISKYPPAPLFQVSGMGYYGSGPEICDEKSPKGNGFLADLCRDWEDEAKKSDRPVIILRTAPVMDFSGGMMKILRLVFMFGIGGRLGDGKQMMSWISLDDWLGALFFLIEHQKNNAIFNLSAPEPISNKLFTSKLSRKLNRPAIVHVPKWVLNSLPGDMGPEFILSSRPVRPSNLTQAGYSFIHPTIDQFFTSNK